MEENCSQSHLSFKEYSTNYQYCASEETQHNPLSSHCNSSLKSLGKENKNPLVKEVNQFLSLLQGESKEDPKNSSNKIFYKTQELPVIFSTEESAFSDNNEKIIGKIEKELATLDIEIKRIKAVKEKTKSVLQEEVILLDRKCHLLEKKQEIMDSFSIKNSVPKSIEELQKMIKLFSMDLEKFIKNSRYEIF